MVTKDTQRRHACCLSLSRDCSEFRGLVDCAADIEADNDQNRACKDREAPSPSQEMLLGQQGDRSEGGCRKQQPDRRSCLWQAAEERFVPLRRVLYGQDDGSTHLSSYGKALQNTKNDEEDSRPEADRPIGRKEPDEGGGGAHADKTQHQHPLASDAVPKMPEHHGADWTGEETGCEGREGCESRGRRVELGKEQTVEHEGSGSAKGEKIESLDCGSDGRCQRHAGQPTLVDGANRARQVDSPSRGKIPSQCVQRHFRVRSSKFGDERK